MQSFSKSSESTRSDHLARKLGLVGLIATGICSMLGASVFIVPFMIQRNVSDLGPYVIGAFAIASIPALLAAFSYAMLASAMPRAGGSYVYASRGLSPYLGFIASFSQWFGLSIVIGAVSYVTIPFFRDAFLEVGWTGIAAWLEIGIVRLSLAMALLWIFVWVNIKGVQFYQRTLVPLMILMFALGGIVIFTCFVYDRADFLTALQIESGISHIIPEHGGFKWSSCLMAATVLFASFIGFDSVAQAGGEAKNPTKNLPLAIVLTIILVGIFYMAFTASVYNIVPWSFVAEEAEKGDISAPGLLGIVLPPVWSVGIILGAAIALVNDLPAMLLSVSRLMFAWSKDGIFPSWISGVHPSYKSPHKALIASGLMASLGIIGCHFAGDFFLGVDIMVISMMVNFILMCLTVITIKSVNPDLAGRIKAIPSRRAQLVIAVSGILVLIVFLTIHITKDFSVQKESWYYHSTPVYMIVMIGATLVYRYMIVKMRGAGTEVSKIFQNLPQE